MTLNRTARLHRLKTQLNNGVWPRSRMLREQRPQKCIYPKTSEAWHVAPNVAFGSQPIRIVNVLPMDFFQPSKLMALPIVAKLRNERQFGHSAATSSISSIRLTGVSNCGESV